MSSRKRKLIEGSEGRTTTTPTTTTTTTTGGGDGIGAAFSQLSGALSEVVQLHRSGSSPTHLRSLLGKCSLLLIELKEKNREIHLGLEDKKKEIEAEKQGIDDQTAVLNTLLYQKNYFRREIKHCQEYE